MLVNDPIFEISMFKIHIVPFILSVEESPHFFLNNVDLVVIVLNHEMSGFIIMSI